MTKKIALDKKKWRPDGNLEVAGGVNISNHRLDRLYRLANGDTHPVGENQANGCRSTASLDKPDP